MLKMSFYNGTLDRKELVKFINSTDKPIVYTYGLGYRRPATYRSPRSKEEAVHIAETASLLDANEERDCLHLNAYSDMDMW